MMVSVDRHRTTVKMHKCAVSHIAVRIARRPEGVGKAHDKRKVTTDKKARQEGKPSFVLFEKMSKNMVTMQKKMNKMLWLPFHLMTASANRRGFQP
ncbi:hypothetical protein PRIC1_009007 [Phytophthora ramorum]